MPIVIAYSLAALPVAALLGQLVRLAVNGAPSSRP